MPVTRGYMRALYPLLMAPSRPPKFSNASLSALRFLGKLVAPQVLKNFFSVHMVSVMLHPPYMCILKMLSSH